MKKLFVFITAIVITLSLAACGGVDKDAVTDAFNSTNQAINTVGTLANEHLDKMDQETMDALQEIVYALKPLKAEIQSDDLTQARADEIITELNNYSAEIAELKITVDTLIGN